MSFNLIEYLVIIGLVLLNAFFAASEIAIVTVRKARIKQLADEGNRSARAILRLSGNTSRFLSTIQVGITLAGFFASAFGALSLARLLEAAIKLIPLDFIQNSAGTIAFIIVTAFLAFISIVFGELIPKTLAIESAEGVALTVARPIEFIAKITSPIVAMLTGVTNFFVRLLGGSRRATSTAISEEELVALVETAQDEGVFEAQETEYISRVLQFTDRQVREIMIPRLDMTMLRSDLSVQEAAREVVRTGYSRYPLYQGEQRENIIGIAYSKDLLKSLTEGQGDKPVSQNARPPYYVPESKKVADLVQELQRKRTQIAIVIDEYGGLAGLVTLEDCLEEIVGEIQDEYDSEESRIRPDGTGGYWIDGATPLSEISAAIDLDIADPEVETIAGLVFKLLGRVAAPNDVATTVITRLAKSETDEDDVRREDIKINLQVQQLEGLRIKLVHLTWQVLNGSDKANVDN